MTDKLMQLRHEIETMRHPAMTDIEENLKTFRNQRPDIHNTVLNAEEMSRYVLWMAESYRKEAGHPADPLSSVPAVLHSGGISAIGQQLLDDPGNPETRRSLAALYGSSEETRFFLDSQDISAGIFLRYLPAYWREDAYFEVYYCFSGACPVYFSNETVSMRPGTVLIIPPGIKKACNCPSDNCRVLFFMIRKSTFARVFWAHLTDQNLMSHFFRQALGPENSVSYLLFDTGMDTYLESLICSIYLEYNRNQKYTSGLLNSMMSTFFLRLLQDYEDTASVSNQSSLYWKPEFADILKYIQENFRSVSLEELSSRFHYSRRQLIRIIQGCTGSNFTELQRRLRMERSARLLSAGNMSVEQIAGEVGFSDRSSFCRAFARYYGCPPGQYTRETGDGGVLPVK